MSQRKSIVPSRGGFKRFFSECLGMKIQPELCLKEMFAILIYLFVIVAVSDGTQRPGRLQRADADHLK